MEPNRPTPEEIQHDLALLRQAIIGILALLGMVYQGEAWLRKIRGIREGLEIRNSDQDVERKEPSA